MQLRQAGDQIAEAFALHDDTRLEQCFRPIGVTATDRSDDGLMLANDAVIRLRTLSCRRR